MNAPFTFGPCSRFMAKPVYIHGLVCGFELFDAHLTDKNGHSMLRSRHTFATDMFERAAALVEPEHVERTAAGQNFIPT